MAQFAFRTPTPDDAAALAGELKHRARAEARRRGFTEGRPFRAAGYGRARRFSERQGWRTAGEPDHGGLELVEYRLRCPTSARPPSS